MPRWGYWRVGYDPDASTPLPRPFGELAGEGARGSKAVELRGAAPPERPNLPGSPTNLYSNKHLAKPPHTNTNNYAGRDDVKFDPNTDIHNLTKEEAKALGLDQGAGHYIVYRKRVPVVGAPGSYAWVIRFQYIPPDVWAMVNNPMAYANDPAALVKAARWLWQWGYKKAYTSLWNFIKARTNEIRRDQQQEWDKIRKKAYSDYNAIMKQHFPGE